MRHLNSALPNDGDLTAKQSNDASNAESPILSAVDELKQKALLKIREQEILEHFFGGLQQDISKNYHWATSGPESEFMQTNHKVVESAYGLQHIFSDGVHCLVPNTPLPDKDGMYGLANVYSFSYMEPDEYVVTKTTLRQQSWNEDYDSDGYFSGASPMLVAEYAYVYKDGWIEEVSEQEGLRRINVAGKEYLVSYPGESLRGTNEQADEWIEKNCPGGTVKNIYGRITYTHYVVDELDPRYIVQLSAYRMVDAQNHIRGAMIFREMRYTILGSEDAHLHLPTEQ